MLPFLSRLYPSIALRFLFANLVFLNGSQILVIYYISILADVICICFIFMDLICSKLVWSRGL